MEDRCLEKSTELPGRALVGRCQKLLENMAQAIQRKQWREVASMAESYTVQVAGIRHIAADPVELMRLELMHRRLMRNLYQYMQASAHDIESLDHGIQRLQHNRNALQGRYPAAS